MENYNTGEIIIYRTNSKLLKVYQLTKILYIATIISILSITLVGDNNKYNTILPMNMDIYLYVEVASLICYIVKLWSREGSLLFCRSIGSFFNFIWVILTVFGTIALFRETKTTDSLLYYLSVYICFSNIIWMILYTLLVCTCYRRMNRNYQPVLEEPSVDTNRRAALTIINDLSEIQLFARFTGIKNETMCSICYEDFKDDDSIRILPCEHYYHTKCVDQWFENKTNCPTCRYELVADMIV